MKGKSVISAPGEECPPHCATPKHRLCASTEMGAWGWYCLRREGYQGKLEVPTRRSISLSEKSENKSENSLLLEVIQEVFIGRDREESRNRLGMRGPGRQPPLLRRVPEEAPVEGSRAVGAAAVG